MWEYRAYTYINKLWDIDPDTVCIFAKNSLSKDVDKGPHPFEISVRPPPQLRASLP